MEEPLSFNELKFLDCGEILNWHIKITPNLAKMYNSIQTESDEHAILPSMLRELSVTVSCRTIWVDPVWWQTMMDINDRRERSKQSHDDAMQECDFADEARRSGHDNDMFIHLYAAFELETNAAEFIIDDEIMDWWRVILVDSANEIKGYIELRKRELGL